MSVLSPADTAERLNLPAVSPEEDIKEWLALLRQDFKSFDEKMAALPPEEAYPLTLDVYTHEAAATLARYQEAGIPEEVFWDGAKTLQLWRDDCFSKYGIDGIKLRAWPNRFFKMEIFRLGRLEFEEGVLPSDVKVAHAVYKKGTPCLHVHIPAGEPLDLSAVHYSLAAAPAFYRKYKNKSYDLFHCASWLLSPALIGLLAWDSNILRFQQNFTVYGEDFSSRQAEERVFGEVLEDFSEYPETTHLQKAMKQFLLDGGRLSMGFGIIPLSMPADEEIPPFKPGLSFSCGCGDCGGCGESSAAGGETGEGRAGG